MIEPVEHHLAFVVRVDDHFTGAPVPEPVTVTCDPAAPGVRAREGGLRHADGTYRYVDLPSGLRTVHVASATGRWRTWLPATAVTLPLADPRDVVVIEMWPTPRAPSPPGVTAIRGRLIGAAPDQRVELEPTAVPPRGRHTRTDADGEFLFPLPGWHELEPDGQLELTVTVPGHVIAGVEIVVGTTVTAAGATFRVPPGRDTRVRITV